jgi:predicted glycoside hydrolase/deacetylase ChbG (UPF0249 family)
MSGTCERRICIVNGDDFGASAGINRGIIEALDRGILTSASLMINMPGAEEAIRLGRSHPALSVGLHVNLTNEGDPVVDLGDIPAVRAEIWHQYEQFADQMGHAPTHLDSHHNILRQPHLTPLFLELAEQDQLPLREHSPVRYFSSFYGRWDDESHPEHISPMQLCSMLETEVGIGFTELACHPGYVGDGFLSEYSAEREIELQTLCDSMVRRFVAEQGIELLSYHEVRPLLAASLDLREHS